MTVTQPGLLQPMV